jgi:hypothetical protein
MRNNTAVFRAAIAISVPLTLVALAAAIHDTAASRLCLVAAIITFTVMLFEAAVDRSRALRADTPPPNAKSTAPEPEPADRATQQVDRHTLMTARLVEVFSFIGTSTPTLVGVARVDGLTALSGWLDLLTGRLSRATDGATPGAMIIRETLVLGEGDFIPVCEVLVVGGSRRCTLPASTRIELTGDLSVDVAQAVGARQIYLASFDTLADRCWVCVTFTTPVTHELLQPLCDLVVAPASQTLSEIYRHKARTDRADTTAPIDVAPASDVVPEPDAGT